MWNSIKLKAGADLENIHPDGNKILIGWDIPTVYYSPPNLTVLFQEVCMLINKDRPPRSGSSKLVKPQLVLTILILAPEDCETQPITVSMYMYTVLWGYLYPDTGPKKNQ